MNFNIEAMPKLEQTLEEQSVVYDLHIDPVLKPSFSLRNRFKSNIRPKMAPLNLTQIYNNSSLSARSGNSDRSISKSKREY
jgi:hypothetical protein